MAGCSTLPPPRDDGPPATPPARPDAMPTTPLPASTARTLEEYKAEVAHAILHANAADTFIGALPEVLKSIVVLQLAIDRQGALRDVRLVRSNGYKDLESRALQSVRTGGLPRPSAPVIGAAGSVTFMETWLFRDDGKFQIRTLAGPQ